MAETKIIYHMDEEETPYLVKLPVAPERVTLADFKNVLSNRPVHAYKFFFKSMDQDFGVVKEEISDDNAKLPCFNGRVVSWLVLAEGAHSDAGSQGTDGHADLPPPLERTGGIGDSRPPSFHPNVASSRDGMDNETGTESVVSHRRERARRRNREEAARTNGHPRGDRRRDLGLPPDSASTVLSSELESSSFIDSDEDDNTSRLSSSTEQSTSSRLIRKHKRRRRKQRMRQTDRASSFSSITDSTMSLNIITVTLNMGEASVCTPHHCADPPPQVNDVNFENMSNDDAVRVLREIVSQTGPISLTVAKCWDPSPRSYFTIPRADPVRPIDPAAWLSHTAALTGALPRYGTSPCSSAVTRTSSSSLTSSVPGAPRKWRLLRSENGGTREGPAEAPAWHGVRHKLASACPCLSAPLRCPPSASTASPGEASPALVSAWLPTTPAPGSGPPGSAPGCPGNGHLSQEKPGLTLTGSKSSGSTRSAGGSSRRALGREKESRSAGAGGSGSESDHTAPSGAGGSGWRERPASQLSRGSSPRSQASAAAPGLPPLHPLTKAYSVVGGPPGGPPVRELAAVPPELTGSRQSFQKAMGNPCEFFVDIM
uniref:DIX domain-containing protein n=1 Tax=Sus scrofa TaxID=9823 RepID=A0A8D0PW85_PIG